MRTTKPSPGPFRAVLFDLDGVLVDSYEVWFRLLNHAARDFGCPAISPERFKKAFGQGVAADQAAFYPSRSIAEIEAFFHAHFLDHADALEVAPEAPEIFEVLRGRGVATAVITNTPNPLAGDVVRRAGARPDTVVGANDVADQKPAPDMVVEAARRLGVAPERCLVVGDSRYDREAARAAGVTFAGIGGIEGDLVLGSLLELVRYV